MFIRDASSSVQRPRMFEPRSSELMAPALFSIMHACKARAVVVVPTYTYTYPIETNKVIATGSTTNYLAST